MIFKAFIAIANKKGTGFIRLPKNKRHFYKEGELVKVIIKYSTKIVLYARIRKCGVLGVYVPKEIMKKHKFVDKYEVEFEKTKGFFSKIGSDGRIYLPLELVKKWSLKQDDILEIGGVIEDEEYVFYNLIKIRKRENTIEYKFTTDNKLAGKKGVFQIERNLMRERTEYSLNPELKQIVSKFNFGFINSKDIILFYGNRVPIVVNANIDVSKCAYYLGCYLADGTKKGNSWGICASTFEQANYYFAMHKKIVKNPALDLGLTVTSHKKDFKKLKIHLISKWYKNAGVLLRNNKIRIVKSEVILSQNRNKFGALILKEHKELVRIFYMNLLNKLIERIEKTKNKALAIDFICGVLEGDGYPSAKTRGHIGIASNKIESKIIEKVLSNTKLNYKLLVEKGNKVSIRIQSTSILANLVVLKDKLFRYYPKRRQKFIERFLNTASAKFLMGKQESTSGWIKAYFVKEGILTKDHELTEKGKKVKKVLLEMKKGLS